MYSPRSANLSRTINCGTQRSVGKERNRKGGRLHTLPRTLASGANLDSCLDRDRDFGFHRNLSHTVHLTFPDYSLSSLQHLSTGSEMYNIRLQYNQVIVKIPQKIILRLPCISASSTTIYSFAATQKTCNNTETSRACSNLI